MIRLKDRTEYKVCILDPSPEDATKFLADQLAEGWKPVLSYEQDRIIMEKTSAVYLYPQRANVEFCPSCGDIKDFPTKTGWWSKVCRNKFHEEPETNENS